MALAISRRALVAACVVVAASCGRAGQAGQRPLAPAPSLTTMQPGWNRVAGGPHTTCALGTPYAFFVKVGDPRKLAIYFQGGGGCWDAASCDPRRKPLLYKPEVGAGEQPYRGGLLNDANPANPIRGYTTVFVPYCTADVHLGARTVIFTTAATTNISAHRFEIHYNGAANVTAALDWIYGHLPSPRTIFVTGESAGSFPTPVYAVAVSKHYPQARVVQLGDASGAYVSAAAVATIWLGLPVLRAVGMGSGLDSARLTFADLYKLAARAAPRIAFAEVNSAEDSEQALYLRAAGDGSSAPVPVLLRHNIADIESALPAFRSYVWPGAMHTVISRPGFYTVSVDGVRLRDWVDALVNGAPVGDVGASLLSVK